MGLLHSGTRSAGQATLADAACSYLGELADLAARCTDADLLAEVRELEQLRRRFAAADHVLVAELERRGVAARLGPASTAELLQDLVRLSPRQAAQRMNAVRALGPRTGLTGQPLPPLRPATADAASEGLLSEEHAAVIVRTLAELPSQLPPAEIDALEQILLDAAADMPPNRLTQVGTRMLDTYRPDGAQPSEDEARVHRYLTVQSRKDGMVEGSFRLSPAAGAKALAVLHAQAAPLPGADDTLDRRTYRQRMADALEDLCGLALRAGQVVSDGPRVALNLTMTQQQYETSRGLIETSFGQLLSVDTALELARQAALALIVRAANGAILDYGASRRCASPSQARALAARDRGCSFPGCTKPAEWTDRHHIIAWKDGGPTDLTNLTLLCGPHHREFERKGWTCQIRDGLPWWTPPPWIDPDQTPRQNHRIAAGT